MLFFLPKLQLWKDKFPNRLIFARIKKMTLTGRSTTSKKICCEIFRRKIGEKVNLKKTSFQIIFLRIWSQVSDAGAVPRAGGLVDLGLEVVVTELGVALKLQLHRQVLKRTGFGSLRFEPATAISSPHSIGLPSQGTVSLWKGKSHMRVIWPCNFFRL